MRPSARRCARRGALGALGARSARGVCAAARRGAGRLGRVAPNLAAAWHCTLESKSIITLNRSYLALACVEMNS